MNRTTLVGGAALELIEGELNRHANGILDVLAPYEPQAAVVAWLETLRAIEELINLPGELEDDVLRDALLDMDLRGATREPRRFGFVLHRLGALYGEIFARRQVWLLMQLSAMQASFAMNGVGPAASGLATVGNAVVYLQSRRRHLVALLYSMPHACRGSLPMKQLDALAILLPQAEMSGTTITGLMHNRAMYELHEDFELYVDAYGFKASRDYSTLDGMFLEAERVPIVELASAVASKGREDVPPDRVFSAAELRNNIILMESAFAEFELGDTAFDGLAALVRALSYRVKDDFWVTLEAAELEALADEHGVSLPHRHLLVASATTFISALNSHAAFIRVGGNLRGTVTLLSRFLYNFKNVCLYGRRRFQIRSGFIFEQRVKDELRAQGFEVLPIKRIDHKEFDVVAVRDGVVFNVQCKNNLVDPSWIDLDPKRFIRTNRTLERYYGRAIEKERSREHLLMGRLGLNRVEPFVITRFPITTTNPRIVSLAHIHEFGTIAQSMANDTTATR